MVCFVHFYLETRLAPQWLAFFWHLIFQKWSENSLFFVYASLDMCFAPYRPFSASIPPRAVRTPHAFNMLTWKCASRHNSVHFLDIQTSKSGPRIACFAHFNGPQKRAFFSLSHLATSLRTRHFSEPTFRPSRPTNHWKNIVFRDFPHISCTCIFFSDSFSFSLLLLSLLLFYSSLFYSSLFYSSILCFLSLHFFGSLTSKLPMIPCNGSTVE